MNARRTMMMALALAAQSCLVPAIVGDKNADVRTGDAKSDAQTSDAGFEDAEAGEAGLEDACAPGAEVCNGRDDDCDGLIDENLLCTVCGGGLTACSGSCVDLLSSATNCNACGQACAAGQMCARGNCVAACVPSVEVCNELDDDCDGLTDENLSCTPTCPTGQTACTGACVDLMTSMMNCGQCGVQCVSGQGCTAGACR